MDNLLTPNVLSVVLTLLINGLARYGYDIANVPYPIELSPLGPL
jgi:hypothetical protein